jgi:hypothetical protein
MNVKAFKTFGDLAEHFIKCQQQCFPSAATVVESLTFEGMKFFVVDGSENKPAR